MKHLFLSAGLMLFVVRVVAQPAGQVDFRSSDSVAALYSKHSLSDRAILTHKLTSPFTDDVAKFRAIYRWICLNVRNDYSLFLKNKQKRRQLANSPTDLAKWNRKVLLTTLDRLLNDRKTVCTGYAFLLKEMCMLAGIECVMVDGYGRTSSANVLPPGSPNHTWNAVRLNGHWVLCDPTWSAGQIDAATGKEREGEEGYFMAAPELFSLNHYPLDTTWLLLKSKPELTEFMRQPIVHNVLFRHKVKPIHPTSYRVEASRGQAIPFRFEGNVSGIHNVLIQVGSGSAMEVTQADVTRDDCGLEFNYRFRSKGTYALHIIFDLRYAVTYEVVVK